MSEKNPSKNTANDNLIPEHILKCMRYVGEGQYSALKALGEIYEEGLGVKQDKMKAADFYQKFYEEHRGRRVQVDEVGLLIKIGHLYMELGNKYRAAEWYMKAGLQIVQDYPEKQHPKMFKKYKVEKFLIKTGYEEII